MDKQTFSQTFAELYEAPCWQVEESYDGINLTFGLKEGFCSHASNLDWYIDLDAPAQSLVIRVH